MQLWLSMTRFTQKYRNMSLQRDYLKELNDIKNGFPIIGVVWARQVGKTTFLKEQFPNYKYFNLESPEVLSDIVNNTWWFLRENSHIIIDEIQKHPIIFNYLLEIVDTRQIMADFIISGSENLILSEKISQSLAWRVWYIKMEPFSFSELQKYNLLSDDFVEQIFKWFMPIIYDRDISPIKYYEQYIATYIERDVRQIKDIQNLWLFHKFLTLLAGRIGQMINYQSLANDVWVEEKTIKRWLSVLEASYIVYTLCPYYENFGKRYIKSPKIYFTDTWVACRLLWIKSTEELKNSYMIWNLFENMIVSEIRKQINILWTRDGTFFYRDSHQKEIDLIIDKALTQIPIEIKSSGTYSTDFAKWIKYRKELNRWNIKKHPEKWYIIYTWQDMWHDEDFDIINWKNFQYREIMDIPS